MLKKNSLALFLALGCLPIFAETMTSNDHVEHIQFLLDRASVACHTPQPVVIEVRHPSATTKHLTLPKNSPYVSITPGACNKMDKTATSIRKFQDTLISNDGRRIIEMNGNYDPVQQSITGTWSDNLGCAGTLTGTTNN